MSPGAGGDRLELLDTATILERLHQGTREAVAAVAVASVDLERLVAVLVARWRQGGRLIYVGAGTSGRIGVLDAAECEPTFGVPPERVLALVAGGHRAVVRAAEGAEDDVERAAADIDGAGVGETDLVVGLSASGTTPYTVAAVRRARSRGASTAAITARAGSPLADEVEVAVVLDVGPELVEGSTRLKAGTAQKLACNALTTAAFIRLGRVRGRSMVALRSTSSKLRTRARAILVAETGLQEAEADRLLRETGGDLACALVMAAGGRDAAAARELLRSADGDVSRALELARRSR